MAHTDRYYKLKRLQDLCESLSHIVEQMAFNEDLIEFDTTLDNSLKNYYWSITQSISEVRSSLNL